jgi:hypothetical protein
MISSSQLHYIRQSGKDSKQGDGAAAVSETLTVVDALF